jgi:hypothetical protein
MLYVPPKLRLKIEANLASGASPLYVLALEGLSIVAALRELSWQLAVTLSESDLGAAEHAAAVIEVLRPMAANAQVLKPGSRWTSNATLRLHTEPRMIEGSDETEVTMIFDFRVHSLTLSHEELQGAAPNVRAKLIAAYEEELAIIRALDSFVGDARELLAKLRVPLQRGAVLAKAQLFYRTLHRAEMALLCLYTEDPAVRKRLQEYADWLTRLQSEEEERSRPG